MIASTNWLRATGAEFSAGLGRTGCAHLTHYTVETVLELERYLVFANNNRGKKLKKIFDFRFPHLVKTGEIERLYDKWNW